LFYAYLIIAPRCQSAHTGIEFTAGEKILFCFLKRHWKCSKIAMHTILVI